MAHFSCFSRLRIQIREGLLISHATFTGFQSEKIILLLVARQEANLPAINEHCIGRKVIFQPLIRLKGENLRVLLQRVSLILHCRLHVSNEKLVLYAVY